MSKVRSIIWYGKSGKGYTYYIFEIGYQFDPNQPGNYIFAKETKPRSWEAIYIGETDDLGERFDNHHKKECIENEGATHIHAHKSSDDKKTRCAEESDLLAKRRTPCND